MKVLLDTNVVLRHAIQTHPRHLEVRDALKRLTARGWDACVAAQSIYEFWVVATRPADVNGFGYEPTRTRDEVEIVCRTFDLLPEPPNLVPRWLDLCTRHQVHGLPAHDARLVAVMLAHGITHLLTLNPDDFARYPEITPVTPAEV